MRLLHANLLHFKTKSSALINQPLSHPITSSPVATGERRSRSRRLVHRRLGAIWSLLTDWSRNNVWQLSECLSSLLGRHCSLLQHGEWTRKGAPIIACSHPGRLTAVDGDRGRNKKAKKMPLDIAAWNFRTLIDRDDTDIPHRRASLIASELFKYKSTLSPSVRLGWQAKES